MLFIIVTSRIFGQTYIHNHVCATHQNLRYIHEEPGRRPEGYSRWMGICISVMALGSVREAPGSGRRRNTSRSGPATR